MKKITAIFILLFITAHLFCQNTAPANVPSLFILKGNTKLSSGKYVEGVDMELKKNGQTVTKIKSGKNGIYSIQMEVSTTNKNNEYLLYITKDGTVPKTLSIRVPLKIYF
ncbi:MAG: hypothetical protein AABZ32_03485, partial [Bacteroidota bacterium]